MIHLLSLFDSRFLRLTGSGAGVKAKPVSDVTPRCEFESLRL